MKIIGQLFLALTTNAIIVSANSSAPLCKSNHLDLGSGYQQWLRSLDPPNLYTNDVFLTTTADECKGLAFHWKIDEAESTINIAVAVKATGWVGIGFSEVGGMKGADIVYYDASSNELIDSHVGDYYGKPAIDTIQDWTLKSGQMTSDGYIIFEAGRPLFTNAGHEDHAIVDDSDILVLDHRIIGAWGDTPHISYHGNNRVKSSIQLFSSEEQPVGNGFNNFQKEMSERAEGFASLQLSNYSIPKKPTTYHTPCYTKYHLVKNGLYKDKNSAPYLIGFEYLLDPSTVKYVHHIVVYGHQDDICGRMEGQVSIISAWTPGDNFILFPEGMGLHVGNTTNAVAKSFSIQYHFDNRDGDINQVDNLTGLKMFYSYDAMDIEVGMIGFGDVSVNLIGQKIGAGKTKHQFTCPSDCTSERITTVDELTILREFHHAHGVGKRIVTQFIRDGNVVNKAAIDYWDFYQNGIAQVQQEPHILKKGDIVKTICYYETDNVTKYGLRSQDEMCQSYAYYYPRQNNFNDCGPPGRFNFFGSCSGTYEKTNLDTASNFDRPVTLFEPSIPPSVKTAMPSNEPSIPPSVKTAMPSNEPSIPPSVKTSMPKKDKKKKKKVKKQKKKKDKKKKKKVIKKKKKQRKDKMQN